MEVEQVEVQVEVQVPVELRVLFGFEGSKRFVARVLVLQASRASRASLVLRVWGNALLSRRIR